MKIGPIEPAAPHLNADLARLKKSAQQFEGVFYTKLFQAMRETVPEGGLVEAGPGQEMFQGLLDQHIAEAAASRSKHGLGDALFEQLRRRLTPVTAEAAAAVRDAAVGGAAVVHVERQTER